MKNKHSRFNQLFKKLLLISTVSYSLGVAFVYSYQERLLFFPGKSILNECRQVQSLGGSIETVVYYGEELRFLQFSNNKATKTMIVFHGNGGSACHRIDLITRLKHLNLNILLYEYPGYAGDSSILSEENIMKNSSLFVKYLAEEMMLKENLILFGESLGTGVATFHAKGKQIKKLILQSPYTSIVDIAKLKYPFIPVNLILKNRFEAEKFALDVNADVYIFYGGVDQLIPPENSVLQSLSFKSLKRIFKYEERGHNNIRFNNQAFWSDLETILR